MDLADYLAGVFGYQNRPQGMDEFGLNSLTQGWNAFPSLMAGTNDDIFRTNMLNSMNAQNLNNAQAATAQGFYNAAGNTNSAISTSNAAIEAAKQQAAAQQAVAQQNAQAQIAAAQASADAAREVARLQSDSALEQERLRQSTAAGKTQALGPLLTAMLGVFGRGNVGGSGATGGGVQTDYGAGVNLGGSAAQPTNAQQFRGTLSMGQGQMVPQQSPLSVLQRTRQPLRV